MHAPTKYLPVECIFCEEVFRIPQNSAADSVVKCPFCNRGFKAKLALSDDAPIAQTVSSTELDAEVDPSTAIPATNLEDASAAEPRRPKVAPSGKLKQRHGSKPNSNQSFRALKKPTSSKTADKPIESTEGQAPKPEEDFPTKSNSNSINESNLESGSQSSSPNQTPNQSPSRRSSDRRSSSSNRTGRSSSRRSGRRSRSRSMSRMEGDGGWNEIGVDGLPVRGARQRMQELEEHDGEEGGIRELIIICVGGLLCLPVTQLCLWWLVEIDPLHLGPAISNVVPAVVPSQFHAPASQTGEAESSTTD